MKRRDARQQPRWMTHEPPRVDGRVPPSDLEAEAAVVSAVLLDPSALDVVLAPPDANAEPLAPEHFYGPANRLVFDACRALAVEGKPHDVVTVKNWLDAHGQLASVGGAAFLGQLVGGDIATPATVNVAAHARIVLEKWTLRRIAEVTRTFCAHAYGEVADVRRFGDDLEQGVSDILHQQTRSAMRGLRHVMADRFRQIGAAAASGQRILGIQSGFDDHDRKTGGLHPGDLVIVAARPGMGKTSFCLNVACNVAAPRTESLQDESGYRQVTVERSRYGVALFSLEMPKAQIADRFACTEARVDLGKLRQGYLSADDWARMQQAGTFCARLPIWVDETSPLTVLEMRAKVRHIQRELRSRGVHDGLEAPELGLVVVDYLQLMKATGWVQSREQEISEIARDLKNLAKELGVPVVALSQLNRSVENRAVKSKRPMLADLRESGEIEQAADEVVFIYRESYYNREAIAERGIAELIIAKQRNGPTGTVKVRFIESCTKFENLAPGEIPDDYEDAAE